jgi:hypothetical protein
MISLVIAFSLGLKFEGSYLTIILFAGLTYITNVGVNYLIDKQISKIRKKEEFKNDIFGYKKISKILAS